MSDNIDALSSHLECCATSSINEHGCKIRFPDAERRILLSGTAYQTNHGRTAPLSDGLFAWDTHSRVLTAAVELKGGTPEVGHVVEQLQAGADVLNELQAPDTPASFVAVLVAARMPTVAYRKLSGLSVNYRGRKVKITVVKCGGDLTEEAWPPAPTSPERPVPRNARARRRPRTSG